MSQTPYEKRYSKLEWDFDPIQSLALLYKKYKKEEITLELTSDIMNQSVMINRKNNSYNSYRLYETLIRALLRNDPDQFSLAKMLIKKADYLLFNNGVLKGLGLERDLNCNQHMFYTLNVYESTGKITYELSDGLYWQLANTELRGLTTDDLRLPYECILINTSNLPLRMYSHAGRCDIPVAGIYIVEDPCATNSCLKSDMELKELIHIRTWRIFIVGDNPVGTGKDTWYFSIPLPDNMPLEEALEITKHRMAERSKMKNIKTIHKWEDMFKWLMNVVIYATNVEVGELFWENKEARKIKARMNQATGRKKEGLEKKLKLMPLGERLILGKHIVLDRQPKEGNNNEGIAKHSVLVRTRVTGHWRRQAYGPGRTERKWLWIQPFWRGPDMGPINAGTHVLK